LNDWLFNEAEKWNGFLLKFYWMAIESVSLSYLCFIT